MTIPEQNLPLLKRLWIYQRERFPLLVNLIAVSTFTFSAISFSRICRGENGFVSLPTYLIGCFATFTLFLLVRIFDEFKDKEDDAKYRTYLPVPRGVVKLHELRNIGILVAFIQLAMILIFQTPMIYLYLLVIGYLCLMGVEFFIPEFLRRRQILYITSHMFIIPLLDIYSSGLDWLLEGEMPHLGLAFFFGVSYLNGLIVEFGRKFKAPEDEEEGVVSYTGLWGVRQAVCVWAITILVTLIVAILAGWYAGYGLPLMFVLTSLAAICIIPGILFALKPSKKTSKLTEAASAIWTVGMYLSLGGIPMLINLFNA